MDDDKLVELAEEGDQISTRQNVDNDEDNSEIDNKVINHNHMFSASKGGPQVKQGDAQFDEEQGGASQLFEVHTKMACENMSFYCLDPNPAAGKNKSVNISRL